MTVRSILGGAVVDCRSPFDRARNESGQAGAKRISAVPTRGVERGWNRGRGAGSRMKSGFVASGFLASAIPESPFLGHSLISPVLVLHGQCRPLNPGRSCTALLKIQRVPFVFRPSDKRRGRVETGSERRELMSPPRVKEKSRCAARRGTRMHSSLVPARRSAYGRMISRVPTASGDETQADP